ncbi:MAG: hypothetical protein ACLSE4_13960 [Clostridium sp.]
MAVEVLADLLEVRDDAWRNAIEGYLGNNKLLLTVEPKYAKAAMEIYKELDPKKILPGSRVGYRKRFCRTNSRFRKARWQKRWRPDVIMPRLT